MTFKIWANCSFVNVKLLYSEILHIKEEENRIQGLVFALEKSEKDKFGGRLLYFGPPYWNLCLQITLTEVLFVLQKILTFSLRECAKSTWRNPSIFFQWPGQQIWNIQIRDLEEDHKGGILKIAHLSILTTRQGDLRSLVFQIMMVSFRRLTRTVGGPLVLNLMEETLRMQVLDSATPQPRRCSQSPRLIGWWTQSSWRWITVKMSQVIWKCS